MRIILMALLIISSQALSQELATSTESCADHLNTTPKPKVEALLNCLKEMQRDIDELNALSKSIQTEIEISLDKKIELAISRLPAVPDHSAYVLKSELSSYAKKSDLHTKPDLSSYAKKSDLHETLCNKAIKLEVGHGNKYLFYLVDFRVENLTHHYGGAKGDKWTIRCE